MQIAAVESRERLIGEPLLARIRLAADREQREDLDARLADAEPNQEGSESLVRGAAASEIGGGHDRQQTAGIQPSRIVTLQPGRNVQRVMVPPLQGSNVIHQFRAIFEGENVTAEVKSQGGNKQAVKEASNRAGDTLTDTFTYMVQDPTGLIDRAELAITIDGRDDACATLTMTTSTSFACSARRSATAFPYPPHASKRRQAGYVMPQRGCDERHRASRRRRDSLSHRQFELSESPAETDETPMNQRGMYWGARQPLAPAAIDLA